MSRERIYYGNWMELNMVLPTLFMLFGHPFYQLVGRECHMRNLGMYFWCYTVWVGDVGIWVKIDMAQNQQGLGPNKRHMTLESHQIDIDLHC